jgi:hypothetical protein
MQFTALRDPVRPPRDPDRGTRFVVRAMSWAMARLIEGFASYAVGMSPELMWLKDEDSDQTSAPFSGTKYQLSPPNTASRQTVTGAPMASPTAVRAEGRNRDD